MIPTVEVQGKVVLPDAVGVNGGTITYALPFIGYADDGGTQQVIASPDVAVIGSDGSVGFDMIPNDLITPVNSFYLVEYLLGCGTRFRELWQLDSGGADPIDIGDIPRVEVQASAFVPGTLSGLNDTNVQSPQDGEVLTYQSGMWVNAVGGGGSTTLVALTDTTISSPQDRHTLVYNSASGRWINQYPQLPLFTPMSEPLPSAAWRGMRILVATAGTPDVAKICLHDGGTPGSYTWVPYANG